MMKCVCSPGFFFLSGKREISWQAKCNYFCVRVFFSIFFFFLYAARPTSHLSLGKKESFLHPPCNFSCLSDVPHWVFLHKSFFFLLAIPHLLIFYSAEASVFLQRCPRRTINYISAAFPDRLCSKLSGIHRSAAAKVSAAFCPGPKSFVSSILLYGARERGRENGTKLGINPKKEGMGSSRSEYGLEFKTNVCFNIGGCC